MHSLNADILVILSFFSRSPGFLDANEEDLKHHLAKLDLLSVGDTVLVVVEVKNHLNVIHISGRLLGFVETQDLNGVSSSSR